MSEEPLPVNTSQELHESRRKPRLDIQELHRKLLENEATMEKLKSAFTLVANALNGLNGSQDLSDGVGGDLRRGWEINHNSHNSHNPHNSHNSHNPHNHHNHHTGEEPANRPGRGNSHYNRNRSHHSNGYRSYRGSQD